jgi:hypothetical protein
MLRGRLLAQRHAQPNGAGGEVLGELATDGGVGDEARAGEQLLDLAMHVRRVPRRPRRP